MTGAIFYPPADRTTQWFGPSNATVPPNKILWHTMETLGWPGYNNGGAAPNLGYDPWGHIWRQHFPLNGTSRALANGADGYATNRKGVCQVEIAATKRQRAAKNKDEPRAHSPLPTSIVRMLLRGRRLKVCYATHSNAI